MGGPFHFTIVLDGEPGLDTLPGCRLQPKRCCKRCSGLSWDTSAAPSCITSTPLSGTSRTPALFPGGLSREGMQGAVRLRPCRVLPRPRFLISDCRLLVALPAVRIEYHILNYLYSYTFCGMLARDIPAPVRLDPAAHPPPLDHSTSCFSSLGLKADGYRLPF